MARRIPVDRARALVRQSGPAQRVSSIELFFDLVFVFTVTQLTQLVGHGAAGCCRRCSCSG